MPTFLNVVEGALKHLGVKASEVAIEAAEAQDALDDLNDMGEEWEGSGINVGFIASTDLNATFPTPRDTISAYKANLAIRLAPQYEKIVSPALAKLADDTFNALTTAYVFVGDVEFPGTLPTGSGNRCSEVFDRRFFNQNKIENF